MILRLEGVNSGYGKSLCCMGIDIEIHNGERVCILGRNGVGKTTLLKTIMGILPAYSGRCLLNGKDVIRMSSFRIARLGVGYVPQGREIFSSFSVKDNLRLGTVAGSGRVGDVDENIFEYFPILRERFLQRAGTLSGGEQQMLSIARALVGKPKILLLDEPSEGIQPNIVDRLREIIKRISVTQRIAVLLVEQNLEFALDITDRGYVMEKGCIVEEGTTEKLKEDAVVKAYLGI